MPGWVELSLAVLSLADPDWDAVIEHHRQAWARTIVRDEFWVSPVFDPTSLLHVISARPGSVSDAAWPRIAKQAVRRTPPSVAVGVDRHLVVLVSDPSFATCDAISVFLTASRTWITSAPVRVQPSTAAKIQRNATCPCGSGKKYRRCCGG
jgi:hypothetical protein